MPYLILVLLAVALWGVLRMRSGKPGAALAMCGLLGIFLISWHPMAWLVSRPLEGWYAQRLLPPAEADAIVVLSGNLESPTPELPVRRVAANTYARCFYAAWLHKNWRAVPVIASGGGRRRYAVTMGEELRAQGVPEALVWVEDRSGSTHESAVLVARMLRDKGFRRVALVTEAVHMLRSERSFRRQGLEVIPAPCVFRALRFNWMEMAVPGWNPIQYHEAALHEYVGLAWYWLRGRL